MRRTALWIICSVAMVLAGALLCHAESFSGTLLVKPNWTHTKTGATTASEVFSTLYSWSVTSGTNANQINKMWVSQRTLTNSATETIDIAGGITNSFGTQLDMSNVRMMIFKSSADNSDSISIGGAAANAFDAWVGAADDTVILRAGAFLLISAPDATGYAVSTNGNIKVTNQGTNSVTYDVYIGGS